jgi:hypothetical protein
MVDTFVMEPVKIMAVEKETTATLIARELL